MDTSNVDVLIIEDSKEDIELYSRLLKKIFICNIETHSIAENAMEAIKKKQYDIILLDYHLPSMNGVDFLHTMNLMNLDPACPIIALTGQGSEKVAVEFMRLGVADYIQKNDISFETLSHAIYTALENFHKKVVERERQLESFRFAHTVAHDLKSPLGRVASYSRLVAKKYPGIDSGYIQNIQEDVQYMTDFLDNLLLYAEAGRAMPEKTEVDLDFVVQKSMKNLELEILAKNVLLNVSHLPTILGNKIALIQLFQNLISNSIKYCLQRPIIHISAEIQNTYAVVMVADNGIGIKPEMSKEVFKPFTRLANKLDAPGVGLGLALCKTIARQHEATIELAPCASGEGANIAITFPLYTDANYIR
jgi:signal transduction histidine kinase